jgi:NADH-quinone oxidoreductase subunit M
MGILSVLLWTPAVGALLIAIIPKQYPQAIKWVANLFPLIALLLSGYLLTVFDYTNPDTQFNEHFTLNPRLGSAYALGVDGISMPMLALATLLTSVAVLASYNQNTRIRGYYFCIMLLQFGMLGVFMAQDWLIFFIFWELTLTPLFFLIDRWGGSRRHSASLNFVLYTMGGGVFMQLSLLEVFEAVPDHTSLMSAMSEAARHMPVDHQILVVLGFIIGFGVKMPLFPLHGWLPLAHVEAPSPVSILLSGIMLKMGAYGLIRVVSMMPDAAHALQPVLLFLALFGMIYGGLLAWKQTDLKGMIAYSSVSHMGVVMLGIATLSPYGLTAAVLQMTAHGLIAGALFLLAGLLYERTHTRNISDYSGLAHCAPRLTLLFTITLLAAMGLPGSVGFIAELTALIAGFQQWQGLMFFFCISILIAATYAFRTITQLFTGTVKRKLQDIQDLHAFELYAAGILVAGILGFGFAPAPLITLSEATITHLHSSISRAGGF